MATASASEVVAFWTEAGPDKWFEKDSAFDARFASLLLETHYSAARRECDAWADTPQGTLALMVLLDQLPRNCFRGTGHMYATDPLALSFARKAVERGFDREVAEELRVFVYLPFMHSEALADQEASLRMCLPLGGETAKAAQEHLDIVARFGRFPHRNRMLGRDTTPAEQTFLDGGGFAG